MGTLPDADQRAEGLLRPRRVVRWAVLALFACVAVAGPMALGTSPAAASSNTDESVVSLTFVTIDGSTLTCSLYGKTVHDTDSNTIEASQMSLLGDSTMRECSAHHWLTVDYTDPNGVAHSIESGAVVTNVLNLYFGAVASDITATHVVSFDRCDTQQNPTCTLSTTTAPK